jgi:flagellin-like hook-associated protein FlgL
VSRTIRDESRRFDDAATAAQQETLRNDARGVQQMNRSCPTIA